MALNEQTDMVFGDQPVKTDPVSGNEVPPGALPSEVRDDIPARLSEGEYVVPADVLQYYGIKFFEDLRNKAKTKLAGLEEDGRMGGEPMNDASMEGMEEMPFSLDELKTYEDDAEGCVQGFYEGGITSGVAPATTVKTYINAEGSKLYIRFVNGIAIPPVPPGYTEEGVEEEDAGVDPTVISEQERLEQENREDDRDGSIWDGTKDPIRMTTGELAMAMAIHSGGSKINVGKIPGPISAVKKLGEFLSGNSSMSKILQKEAVKRLEDTTGLSGEEVKVLTNLSNLDITKINTWRETLSKPLSAGGAATSLNKLSDIFKGRNDPTRTGTGIQTFDGDYDMFLDPSTATATSKFYENKRDADAARTKLTTDSSGRTLAERRKQLEGLSDEATAEELKRESEKNIAAAKAKLEEQQKQNDADGDRDNNKTAEEKATELGQQVGKGYTGGYGFNKGGLASKRKKKK